MAKTRRSREPTENPLLRCSRRIAFSCRAFVFPAARERAAKVILNLGFHSEFWYNLIFCRVWTFFRLNNERESLRASARCGCGGRGAMWVLTPTRVTRGFSRDLLPRAMLCFFILLCSCFIFCAFLLRTYVCVCVCFTPGGRLCSLYSHLWLQRQAKTY